MTEATNWKEVTKSVFAWEIDALEFVRQQFPAHAPYHAWSNFEFIADDGTINEIDLLVFTPNGFLLIEIKSRPGRLRGDAGTWIWETEGKPTATLDNPRLLANLKAKKLRSLLQRQKAFRNKGTVPWIDALVFCSAQQLKCELQGNAALGVVFREPAPSNDSDTPRDIMTAIRQGKWPGARNNRRDHYDRPTLRMVAQAMEQAGYPPHTAQPPGRRLRPRAAARRRARLPGLAGQACLARDRPPPRPHLQRPHRCDRGRT